MDLNVLLKLRCFFVAAIERDRLDRIIRIQQLLGCTLDALADNVVVDGGLD